MELQAPPVHSQWAKVTLDDFSSHLSVDPPHGSFLWLLPGCLYIVCLLPERAPVFCFNRRRLCGKRNAKALADSGAEWSTERTAGQELLCHSVVFLTPEFSDLNKSELGGSYLGEQKD